MALFDTDKKVTQSEFAELVGTSQPAVSQRLKSGVLSADDSLGSWLHNYCHQLRQEAAGRTGAEHNGLTAARTREASASADLKLLQIKERVRELVPVAEIEPRLIAMVTAARTQLLVLPGVLAQELRALHGVEIDPAIIEDRISEALSNLATSLQEANDEASATLEGNNDGE